MHTQYFVFLVTRLSVQRAPRRDGGDRHGVLLGYVNCVAPAPPLVLTRMILLLFRIPPVVS